MYQKPDFIKVSVKANDVFGNYDASGCPQDERGSWVYTQPCDGSEDYHYEYVTFTGLGFGIQCYSSFNP